MSATPSEPMTQEQRIEIIRRTRAEWWNWCAALEVRVELLMEKAGIEISAEELSKRIQALSDERDEADEAGSTKPPTRAHE